MLARALNARAAARVRVLTVEETAPDFHARFSAVGKAYEYRIVNAPIVSPFHCSLRLARRRSRLDVDAMRVAAAH